VSARGRAIVSRETIAPRVPKHVLQHENADPPHLWAPPIERVLQLRGYDPRPTRRVRPLDLPKATTEGPRGAAWIGLNRPVLCNGRRAVEAANEHKKPPDERIAGALCHRLLAPARYLEGGPWAP
jgi:hypothetical protein